MPRIGKLRFYPVRKIAKFRIGCSGNQQHRHADPPKPIPNRRHHTRAKLFQPFCHDFRILIALDPAYMGRRVKKRIPVPFLQKLPEILPDQRRLPAIACPALVALLRIRDPGSRAFQDQTVHRLGMACRQA
jgi:hypothetical protein